jgi:putative ABC transport system permease protein
MRDLPRDLWLALRNLWSAPGFALTATATLALGIGANTAIFSVVNAILLRPLPLRDPDRLVRLYETEAAPGKYPFAGPDFVDWKAQNRTFEDMALFGGRRPMNLSGEGLPDSVLCVPTAANFFSVLGAKPFLGRTWALGEDQPGNTSVAILSHGLWRNRYAGDPRAIGQTIELNSLKHTIVGVMPADFLYPTQAQLWIPMDMSSAGLGQRGNHWAQAVGRMKPGVTPAAALADLTVIATRLEQTYPDSNHKVGAGVVPLHEDLAGRSRDSLLLLLGAVGLVLLIACANVANLLLSRAVARQKEMAVRSALGAGRSRLFGQLLTESLVLAALGGALGLLLGWGLVELLARAKSAGLPQFAVIRLDGAVLAFTGALAVATGVVFGIYPALQASRPDLHEELKGGAGSSVSPSRRRRFASNALVVSEFAFSLLLLASAGLLLKDFARLRNTDIGVRPEGLWTGALRLPEARYADNAKRLAFAESLLDRARQIPGVDTAIVTDRLPVEGGSNYYIHIRGQAPRSVSSLLVERRGVTPGYFQGLGIRLLKGRVFTPADTQTVMTARGQIRQFVEARTRPTDAQTNAIIYPTVINEAMSKAFWPNQDPLGQMFSSGNPNGPWRQVIGVVSDIRQRGLITQPAPEACDIFDGGSSFFLILRTRLPPAALTSDVRRRLEQLDPSLPLFSVRTMDQVIDDDTRDKRFLTLLIGCFAALAALLAAIGIYGVLSYVVTQRTREIGVRIALGASRGRVLGEVLRDGARLVLVGFAVGVGGALACGRILASLLNQVRPSDPTVLAATAGLLAAVALAACYLPARRAARLDPMAALRHE